jgi:hypothetical protein
MEKMEEEEEQSSFSTDFLHSPEWGKRAPLTIYTLPTNNWTNFRPKIDTV